MCVCALVRACVSEWVRARVCVRSSLHSLRSGQLLRCEIVNRIKVYIERNNLQVQLIRFRKQYRLNSRLLLRSEEFNATDVFTFGKSLHHKPVDSNHFNYP